MVNDESRKTADLADIESLLEKHATSISWDLLESYFSVFDLNDLFDELQKRYRHVK